MPRHININYYLDLPILVYDDLSELTEQFLEDKYKEIFNNSNLEKSTMSYWRSEIRKEKAKHER